MGWCPRCYIQSFKEIGQLVPEKKIFEGFFTIYRRGGHLGHVTRMPRTNFRSPYPRRLHIKFGLDWPSGFGVEDVWNCGRTDGRTDDGRTTDDGRRSMGILKAHLWAFGSGELKKEKTFLPSSNCIPKSIPFTGYTHVHWFCGVQWIYTVIVVLWNILYEKCLWNNDRVVLNFWRCVYYSN